MAMLGVLAAAMSAAAIEVECGFGGFIKNDAWFPFRVKSIPGAVDFEVTLIHRDWCSKRETVQERYRSSFPAGGDGPGVAFCRYQQAYQEALLRCAVRRDNGSVEIAEVNPDVLTDDDLLVLVLSDQPEEFNFLGGVNRPARGMVRNVTCRPDSFPAHWQELDCVDVIVLDDARPFPDTARAAALRAWIVAGGTVLLTDRALRQNNGLAKLRLFDELRIGAEYSGYPAEALHPLLGRKTDLLQGFYALRLDAPRGMRILLANDTVLLAGRDLGRGRVLASGLNWRDLAMQDRAVNEMIRATLWGRMLEMAAPPARATARRNLVLPPEARLSHLARPLGLFLISYVLLLGPLNWLILKFIRREEYSAFTLPLGALVFSALAFAVGIRLRSSDPVVREAEYWRAYPDGSACVNGIIGLLSPDRRPYCLRFDEPGTRAEEQRERFRFNPPRPEDIMAVAFDGRFEFSNVRVNTWSMRFFQRETPWPDGPGVRAAGHCSSNGISGTISNGLPTALLNAFVIANGNLAEVGNIPAGAAADFQLQLAPPGTGVVCARCGQIHSAARTLAEHQWREHPRLAEMRDLIESADLPRAPVLVALQEQSAPTLKLDRDNARWAGRRLVMAPVELHFDGPDVYLPEGLVQRHRPPQNRNATAVAQTWELPYSLQVTDPDALEENDAARRRRDSFTAANMSDEAQFIHDFYLPFEARSLSTTRLLVHWDIGPSDPDTPHPECALALYDWGRTQWVEQVRADTGDQRIVVADPDRFIRPPFPVLRVKVAPLKPGRNTHCAIRILDIAFEGRKTDDRETLDSN